MRENVVQSGPPEVEAEIKRALEVLQKRGYQVDASEGPSGDLAIDFKFGATEQTLKFSKDEWQRPGTVEKRIVDDLDI